MKQSEKIFLAAAEELSFAKAAQKAFVTQQCVSDHLKRLEQDYHTILFERKPKLKLTPAGMDMLKTLRQIQVLENTLKKTLDERADGRLGAFTAGISTSRAQILLPAVLPRYYRYFPDVQISFSVNDTIILEEELRRGSVDLLLGVNPSRDAQFSFMPLAKDELFLCISASLFSKHFSQNQMEQFKRQVDLKAFAEIPFVLYYSSGALNKLIQLYLDANHIELKHVPYYISDCDTHILLCQSGLCATLVPKMLALRLYNRAQNSDSEQEVLMFPVRDFHYPIQVDLIWNKDVNQPLYIRAFCEMLQEEAERIMASFTPD